MLESACVAKEVVVEVADPGLPEPFSSPALVGPIEALAALPSDPTGAVTFERFLWQAKMALIQWLGTLSHDKDCGAVVCELIDDIVSVYSNRYVFKQLKTKDRGSWSIAAVTKPGGGLDALIRSWNTVFKSKLHEKSSFELLLEGPMSQVAATVAFFENPTSAGKSTRAALVERGLKKAHLDDFLARLTIRSGMTSRASIDAVLLQTCGALWPSLSYAQLGVLLENLLSAVEAAQANTTPSISVLQHLRAAADTGDEVEPASLLNPVLSREKLRALTPPLPDEGDDELLSRLSDGGSTSRLELKLRRAGAGSDTLQLAQDLRAQADVERQLILASGGSTVIRLVELEERVLLVARGASKKHALVATPVMAAKPGEVLFNDFLSDPSKLANLDHDRILDARGLLVLGLLCHISDECRFPWR